MVVGYDADFSIGHSDGRLIKRDSADLKQFKGFTRNHVCIVGRKTYDDVSKLPDRKWICLTRDKSIHNSDILSSDTITHAITFARQIAATYRMSKDIIIAGGAEIYNQALNLGLVDEIRATIWQKSYGGDVRLDRSLLRNFDIADSTRLNTDDDDVAYVTELVKLSQKY